MTRRQGTSLGRLPRGPRGFTYYGAYMGESLALDSASRLVRRTGCEAVVRRNRRPSPYTHLIFVEGKCMRKQP